MTLIGAGDGDDPTVDTILDGEGTGPVVGIEAFAKVELRNLRITRGSFSLAGGVNKGMVSTATMIGCAVIGNEGEDSGGILNQGKLTLIDCRIEDSTATGDRPITGSAGGIHNYTENSDAELTLDATFVTGNRAIGAGPRGGGIYNPDFVQTGKVELKNGSSVSNNEPNDCAGEGTFSGSGCASS